MKDSVDQASAGSAVLALVDTINKNRDYLSEIDGAIGDGDHGVNMSTGFTRFGESVAGSAPGFADALEQLGTTLLTITGGSLGPLYGTLFTEMADSVRAADPIDAQAFSRMLSAGLDGVLSIGGAKAGDKTMIDSLSPAASAFSSAQQRGLPFAECLEEMSDAAAAGAESTRDMVARVGRASRLGERSRGTLDAGATSCRLILQSLAASFSDLLSSNP